jgi:hypothetical protein
MKISRESLLQRLANVGCKLFTDKTPIMEIYKYIEAAAVEFELSVEECQTLTQIITARLINSCK